MRRRNWYERGERRFRLILLGILILMLAAIHFIDPSFYPTIYHLSKDGDLHGTIHYLKGFGIYAAFVSFFIDVIINIVGLLPSIISWLAETVGVILSFYVMRTLFRGMAMNLINKSKTLSKLDSYESWQAIAAARAIPYMPNGLITAIAALSSMKFKDYAFGCLLGKLPSTALEVVLGHDVVNLEEHSMRLTIIIILVTVIYGFIWWKTKKQRKSGQNENNQ